MIELEGKWIQTEGQPYEGLWFKFLADGSFTAEYEPMGIVSSGTYETANGEITIQQTTHTLGFIGEFKGRYAVKEKQLLLALAVGAGQDRPEELSEARIYQKE